MIRAVFAFAAALLVTGVMMLAALEGVSWLMNSHAVWSVVRAPWFTPSMLAFSGFWICIWLPLYVSYCERKKAGPPRSTSFIERHSA